VGEFFSSIVSVDVCYDSGQEQALQETVAEIWSRFADIHWRLSVYDPNSDMNRINHSYPDPVTVGADTWLIIKDSVYYNQISLREFDITIYPMLKLWKDSEKKGVLPTPEQIHLAQQSIGPDKFELLPKNQVRLLNPGTQLTIDSIAGNGCEGRPWRIGVKDPSDLTGSQLADVLALKDSSVTTSGNYEHFYTIGDKRYSHIISPITGFPRNEIVSVTVIAPSTEFSDFWSTALCLIDPQKGIDLIDSLGKGYASMVLVDSGNGRLIRKASRNYSRYLAH
jgi:thiamine biosynthesis lipoprotein